MSDTPIHILLVEDNPGDARLIHEALRETGDRRFETHHAPTLANAVEYLKGPICCEVILLDLSLPDSQGLETIRRIEQVAPTSPIVVMTGLDDEALGLEALRMGAQDYLVKSQTDDRLLVRAIRYAMERKRTQDALAREHNRLRAVLDILPVGVFLADAQGRLLEANPAAQGIWGDYAPLSQHPDEYTQDYKAWWPETGQRIQPHEWGLTRALRTGEVCSGEEMEIETHDGQRKTILNYALPIRNGGGAVIGGVEINVDITQRKQNLRALRILNETLEQRVAERTAIAERRAAQLRALAGELTQAEQRERRRLAQLLHDHLQQLLVAGRMSVGTLRRRVEDPAALKTLGQLDELLEESVEASRSLSMELSPPVLYDAGLSAALIWLGRHMRDKHDLKVDVQLDPAAQDPAEDIAVTMFQAAKELLFNVVKHARTDRAVLRASSAMGQFRIDVIDQGVGCDPQLIWEGEESATGFGLFSVQERLELLGGRLEINGAPGQGCQVSLIAPLHQATPPPEPVGRPAGRPARISDSGQETRRSYNGRIRVLLADDHKILRQGVAGLLAEQLDIEVVAEAQDGQMALELAHEHRPDVVIMDVTMPRMSGIEATRRITDEIPGIRVIGLSMHEESDLAAAMRDAGAAAYLTKGGPADLLIAAIRACSPLPYASEAPTGTGQPPAESCPDRV